MNKQHLIELRLTIQHNTENTDSIQAAWLLLCYAMLRFSVHCCAVRKGMPPNSHRQSFMCLLQLHVSYMFVCAQQTLQCVVVVVYFMRQLNDVCICLSCKQSLFLSPSLSLKFSERSTKAKYSVKKCVQTRSKPTSSIF